MKLYLVRHGETESDQVHAAKQSNPPLTKSGQKQARAVAEKLADKKIELIVASNLKRTAETAEILAQKLDVEIIFNDLIRERNMGNFRGGARLDDSAYDRLMRDAAATEKLGIETIAHLDARARLFLEQLPTQIRAKTIVVVSHNAVINSIIQVVNPGQRRRTIGHTEVVEIDLDPR